MDIKIKYCPKCDTEKPVSEFYVNKHSKDGFSSCCKECRALYRNSQREKDKEYREKNKEKLLEGKKRYREKNKEKTSAYNSEYQKRDYVRQKTIEYIKNRYHNDDLFRLKMCVRAEIRSGFTRKGFEKRETTEKLKGCTIEEFIGHLKATYYQNYGVENDGTRNVHRDHIIPISTAKTEDDVKRLCHWSNLQLLNAEDNLKKSNSLEWGLFYAE